jgi:hypothetical protein
MNKAKLKIRFVHKVRTYKNLVEVLRTMHFNAFLSVIFLHHAAEVIKREHPLMWGFELLCDRPIRKRYIFVSICKFGPLYFRPPLIMAASGTWNIFARSNTGIVGSNSTQGMDVCPRFFCVCVVLCMQRPWDRADLPSKESYWVSTVLWHDGGKPEWWSQNGRPLLGNGLLTHGCYGVDARLHDNECVSKPESRSGPLLGDASVSAYPWQQAVAVELTHAEYNRRTVQGSVLFPVRTKL